MYGTVQYSTMRHHIPQQYSTVNTVDKSWKTCQQCCRRRGATTKAFRYLGALVSSTVQYCTEPYRHWPHEPCTRFQWAALRTTVQYSTVQYSTRNTQAVRGTLAIPPRWIVGSHRSTVNPSCSFLKWSQELPRCKVQYCTVVRYSTQYRTSLQYSIDVICSNSTVLY